jgi:peroxiredoxin family protein
MDMKPELAVDVDSLVRNDQVTLIVFSGDLDKVQAALTIANGAAATGMKVTLFFTFWGLNVLRKPGLTKRPRNWIHRMLGPMNLGGTGAMPLSRLNFLGLGPVLLRKVMGKVNMPAPETLLASAKELGVQFVACTVTMGTMGIDKDDLQEDLIDEYAGVVTYLQTARQGSVNLFV